MKRVKIPSWLAWLILRVAMEIGTIRLWSKGYTWRAARRLVMEEALAALREVP